MLYNTLMMMSRLIRLLPYDLLLFLGRVLGNLYYLLIKSRTDGRLSPHEAGAILDIHRVVCRGPDLRSHAAVCNDGIDAACGIAGRVAFYIRASHVAFHLLIQLITVLQNDRLNSIAV